MADKPTTGRVKLVDPNGPRYIAYIGADVPVDGEVDVPAEHLEGLLLAPTVWQPVDKVAKDVVAEIERRSKVEEVIDTLVAEVAPKVINTEGA